MIVARMVVTAVTLASVLAVPPSVQAAPAPVLVSRNGDWSAFKLDAAARTVCYVVTGAKDIEPKDAALKTGKEQPTTIYLSTYPARRIAHELTVNLGHALEKGGSLTASIIGGDQFTLPVLGDLGYAPSPKSEIAIVGALRKAAKLVMVSRSPEGVVITETFSLLGLGEALADADKACS